VLYKFEVNIAMEFLQLRVTDAPREQSTILITSMDVADVINRRVEMQSKRSGIFRGGKATSALANQPTPPQSAQPQVQDHHLYSLIKRFLQHAR
jgi:hypothetical protein